MSTRLQTLNLNDFTGGLNLRGSQFTLGDNESPEILNMEIDIRGGVKTRPGWERWNATDIVATPTSVNWDPRSAWTHPLEAGSFLIYAANDGDLYAAPSSGVFDQVLAGVADPIVVTGVPHLADGVSWGNIEYVACGNASPTIKRDGTATYATRLTDAYGNYNDDYTAPTLPSVDGTMPRCEYLEPHAGYLFAAYTKEAAVEPNRLRWSHPGGNIEDWATDDYIDFNATGGHITGLMSFRDHLLIFKSDSLYALYGYGTDSFQSIRIPGDYGAPHPQAIARSETAVYFYSASGVNGIYAYTGDEPIHISEKLRQSMAALVSSTDIWLGWAGRRLWCSIPWKQDPDAAGNQTTLVFDPETGQGAWVAHRSALGDMTCIVRGADRSSLNPMAGIEGSSGAACFVRLIFRDDANDLILENATLSGFPAYYRTKWLEAGWPERRKSWRRPRFVFQRPAAAVEVEVYSFQDYDGTNQIRSGIVAVEAGDGIYWRATGSSETNGWDWGDGSVWSGGPEGAAIQRMTTESAGQGLGVNRAIQLRFATRTISLGKAWGLDLISMKYILRRFTT